MLAGRYELERQLGRGGTATVYLARDIKHERHVALKVLHPELTAAIGPERFVHEMRLEASLQHPHILPLLDSGEADGLFYHVLPFVDGESLRDRLAREIQLPITEAVTIARQVAGALAYAHKHGVVHRDIKPANILLSGGHAIVADFGIAHALGHTNGSAPISPPTSRGVAVGTPEYMSPEQAGGEGDVDARSDVYALGCVVYEMLAGEPPFSGRTAQAVMARQMHEPPASIRIVRPTVPEALQTVIERALAKAPADRYPSAEKFAKALEPFAAEADATRAGGRSATSPRMLFTAIVLATAIALGVWFAITPRYPPPDANKVMVFPLWVTGATVDRDGEGETVAIMIGSALERTDPLKWLDGWNWLDREQRSDISRLLSPTAKRIALAHGARYFVTGSVVRIRDSLSVTLQLYDAADDSVVRRETASDDAQHATAPQLGVRAVAKLLPALLAPGRAIDPAALQALTSRQPAAIANWLQGERAYRQSKFGNALTLLSRAVAADSDLAIAAVRGAEAASWVERLQDAQSLLAVALSRQSLLPHKYAEYAHGLESYYRGDADAALARFRRALAADSAWSAAWMAAGEVYMHLLPRALPPDSTTDALAQAAFTHARSLESDFSPPAFHLAELAARHRDFSIARQWLTDYRRAGPDSSLARSLEMMIDCAAAEGDASRTRVTWTTRAATDPEVVRDAAKLLSGGGAFPGCALDAFLAAYHSPAATTQVRWHGLFGAQALLIATGRAAAARALLDSAATTLPAANFLYAIDADAGADMGTRPAETIASLGTAYDRLPPIFLWLIGVWSAHERDTTTLATVTERLARVSGSRQDTASARSLGARLALLRGDTAMAIATLEALVPVAQRSDLAFGLNEPMAGETMLLAELLAARGRDGDAIRVATRLDHPQPALHLLYLPRSLSLRIASAQRAGRADEVARDRRRLTALGALPGTKPTR